MIVDVHALILKLFDVATVALPDAQVLDGRDYSKDVEKHAVLIGYTANQSEAVVNISRALDQGSLNDTLFNVAVRGTLEVWDGEGEFPAKRAIVQQSLTDLNAAIEADRSLGGIAYDAWLTQVDLFELADTEGNAVDCDFTITVQVYA